MEICKVTNAEPDPEKIPVEFSDLLIDTQLAMQIADMLTDRWDSTAGQYLGKDLTILPYLLELYSIDNKLDVISLIKTIINESVQITNDKIKRKTK